MFVRPANKPLTWSTIAHFVLIAALISALAGLGGAALALLLHYTEHLLFGVPVENHAETPLQIGPLHRFVVIAIAGVVMAGLWWAIRRWGPHAPTPEAAAAGATMSPGWTAAEAIVQVVDVGAGASIGREAAPREVGAMVADRISNWARLSPDERSVLIACAAGGGLAATYNVPLAGAIFGIETVLGLAFFWHAPIRHVGLALATALGVSYGATLAGRVIVPNRTVYHIPEFGSPLSLSTLALAALLGLLFGPLGELLGRWFSKVTVRSPKGNRLLLIMPAGYLLLGALAAWQPLVMGNGHALAQEVFDRHVGLSAMLLLIVLKPLATMLTMGVGARGGRLTPAFSTGTAVGAVGAQAWNHLFPVSAGAASLVGGAVLLAAATGSPVASLVLSVEMTGAPLGMVAPVGLAIACAWIGMRLTRSVLRDSTVD